GELPDPKERIGDLESYMEATRAVSAGDSESAIAALEQIVNRNPVFTDAWTLLGRAYDLSGRYEDAVGAYRKTIDVAPVLAPGTALSLAEVYLKLGRFEDALDHAGLARAAHPSSAALVRARALIAIGRIDEADGALGAALADSATRDEALVVRAQALVAQRRLDEALTILGQLESTPGGPVAGESFTRADILARQGRLDDARSSFRRESEQFPQNREAWIRLAAIHLLQGNAAEAERTMQALADSNPSPSTNAMIAEAYRSLGRPDLAARW
ncbi:MAG: tetratricopeptide repeat protein, partial [Thioalkalivibrio sp.]|nr:tetratricopeptide repeat protein [Thioalkalivibrio sp.]